jgi:diketogulonate reductase-like aldo/keto reductase
MTLCSCRLFLEAQNNMTIPEFLYGTAWKEERTAELVERAVRSGFRGIDTANQRKHYFEAAVGQGLQAGYRAGVVKRDELFLQTKYTYMAGQDHRLPYDPNASVATQVAQSLEASLEQLRTEYVDSFVLHGPARGDGWSDSDAEAWQAMLAERAAGRARHVGVSNVSIRHLEQMGATGVELPWCVQNRCYARLRWDLEIRKFCRRYGILYQGFSLLTANAEIVEFPLVQRIAGSHGVTAAQIIFRFAQRIGIVPLTGTASEKHMAEDLASTGICLSEAEVEMIEGLL